MSAEPVTAAPATRAHALGVSAEYAYVDGLAHPGVFAKGPLQLVRLVERASRAGELPGVVLVVDDDALPLLGLPAQLGPGREHEAAPEEARAAGWRVSDLGHWTSFWRTGAPAVHMVVPAWRSAKYAHGPLVEPGDLGVTTYRLARFHTFNGGPFQLTPGWSGIEALRERKYVGTPYWRPRFTGNLDNAVRGGERDFAWDAATLDNSPYRHRYDANTAYLAAAQLVSIAADQLERTHKAWDKTRAGYWLVTPPPWQHPQILDPTACLPRDDKGRVWLCTPTLDLLMGLAEDGHCAAPTLHDSYTAPGTRKILRPWAERLRDGLAALDPTRHDPDDEAVYRAVKDSTRETVGLFARSTTKTAVYRPDWRHAVASQCRVSLWRRMWAIGQAQDRWPLAVHVDAVTYGSHDPDPVSACPEGITLGPGLGKFHVYNEPPAVAE